MTDTCPDCGLPMATERKTRGAHVDQALCAARFSPHYELQCKRVAIARLRARIAELDRALEGQTFVLQEPALPQSHGFDPPESARRWLEALDACLAGDVNGRRAVLTLALMQAWGIGRSPELPDLIKQFQAGAPDAFADLDETLDNIRDL